MISRTSDYVRIVGGNHQVEMCCGNEDVFTCGQCENMFCLACDYMTVCNLCTDKCSDCRENTKYCDDCDTGICKDCEETQEREWFKCKECSITYCTGCMEMERGDAVEIFNCVGEKTGETERCCEDCLVEKDDLFLLWEEKLQSKTDTKMDATGKSVLRKFIKEDYAHESDDVIDELIDDAMDNGNNSITNIVCFIMLCYYNGDEEFIRNIITQC